MTTSVAVVEGHGVTRRWGAMGLASVDFAIHAGIVTCIKGRSGSGKSTLLALLADLADPDDGVVQWSAELDAVTRGRWNSVALVPQTLLLLVELTVLENIDLALEGVGQRRAFPPEDAAILERLGLSGLGGRTVDTLSMGQRQRVAVGRAVRARPRLLLADEPTSHQDRVSAALVLASLHAEAARGCAVVVASHDSDVIAAADAVIDLDG